MSTISPVLIWLRQQFHSARDVRSTSLKPDESSTYQAYPADISVRTWMGAQLYIYVLLSTPHLRDIKNIMRINSRDSIGTLFFVHGDLLPEEGSRGRLVDWQDALQLLNGGYIYSLKMLDEVLQPVQVHFTPDTTPNEYYSWVLRDFTIETVTVKRRRVDSVIKGTWHVGDIASPEFQRRVNHERANQRFHYRTQYTRSTGSQRKRPQVITDKELLEAQYNLLGLKPDASETTVKAAFRRQAMNVHPDVSALPRSIAEKRMKALLEAYEIIKQARDWK